MSVLGDYTDIVAYRMKEAGYTHISTWVGRVVAVDPYIRKVSVLCRMYERKPVGAKVIEEAKKLWDGTEFCSYGIVASHSGYTEEAKERAKELGVILWDV